MAAPAPAPVAAPAAAAPAPVAASTPAPAAAPSTPAAPQQAAASHNSQFVTAEGLAALTGMGFPESESRAALAAAMGNPDLAYEFLLTGIPAAAASPTPTRLAASPAAPGTPAATGTVAIDALRRHPQFNMLKQLVQTNPAALSQVLDLIGQQSPELLAAIHANNDAFIAMMNEPIVDTPPAAAAPAMPAGGAAGGAGGSPMEMMAMLAQMPAAQRAQFAAQIGMAPEQLDGLMQMMASMPPDQLQQMMGGGMGGGGMGGGMGGADPPGVIRLTEEEMEAVNRLVALGFSQQQAAQAYLACDKNETLAANLLFEGGWGDDGDDMMGGYDQHDHDDDNMYN